MKLQLEKNLYRNIDVKDTVSKREMHKGIVQDGHVCRRRSAGKYACLVYSFESRLKYNKHLRVCH